MASMAVQLTVEEVRRLDAQYRTFPPFAEWPQSVERAELWEARRQELESLRWQADPAQLERALDVVMRMAAVDTGAIEGLYTVDRGFTITVATQAAAWEALLDERGANVRPLFDAQLKTYDLVLDAATRRYPVTEAWIRRLHEELCAPQETYTVLTPIGLQEQRLPKAEYKHYPNHVRLADGSYHAYAPVELTAAEMHRLVAALQDEAFKSAHPVLQAAFAQYALAAVHPFADGNGRVARAVASVYLYRAAWIPLLVFADRRLQYLEALRSADRGELDAFVRFVFDAELAALQLTSESIRTALTPEPEAGLERLRAMVTAQGELTFTDLDRLAATVTRRLDAAFAEAAERLAPPPGISIGHGVHSGFPATDRDGFRPVIEGRSRSVRAGVSVAGPAEVTVAYELFILVSRSRDESESLLVDWPEGHEQLTFGIHDVHPALAAAAEQRIDALAQRVLGRALDHATAEAERVLRERGNA
jgi:Fic family protein